MHDVQAERSPPSGCSSIEEREQGLHQRHVPADNSADSGDRWAEDPQPRPVTPRSPYSQRTNGAGAFLSEFLEAGASQMLPRGGPEGDPDRTHGSWDQPQHNFAAPQYQRPSDPGPAAPFRGVEDRDDPGFVNSQAIPGQILEVRQDAGLELRGQSETGDGQRLALGLRDPADREVEREAMGSHLEGEGGPSESTFVQWLEQPHQKQGPVANLFPGHTSADPRYLSAQPGKLPASADRMLCHACQEHPSEDHSLLITCCWYCLNQ